MNGAVGRLIKLVALSALWIMLASAAMAQGDAPRIAFANPSGQVIVGAGDGGYRWIVTNPGERLVERLGIHWDDAGARIAFAVDVGGSLSLRVADVNAQRVEELATAAPNALTAIAAGGDRFYAAIAGVLRVYAPGAPARDVMPAAAIVRPSNDGRFVFAQVADGRFAVAESGGAARALPGIGDVDAPLTGLWADRAALVAYWGRSDAGTSAIYVVSAANGATAVLDSGRAAPITPLAWRPGTTELVYRQPSGLSAIADVGCLLTASCSADPLSAGVDLLPAGAADVVVGDDVVAFRVGDQVGVVALACAAAGDCLARVRLVEGGVSVMHPGAIGGDRFFYTRGSELRSLALACATGGDCQPVTIGTGRGGALSDDGRWWVIETGGLSAINVMTRAITPLVDAGASLSVARWQ